MKKKDFIPLSLEKQNLKNQASVMFGLHWVLAGIGCIRCKRLKIGG